MMIPGGQIHDQRRVRRHRLKAVWSGMIDRCHNPKSTGYARYGGRGIRVCDDWREDFDSFYSWAFAHGYVPGLTIERLDNDGNYHAGNCIWTTHAVQARNKSTNRRLTIDGVTKCIT